MSAMGIERETPCCSVIYTIGHSNIAISAFLELLGRFSIEVVVDVRSRPFSRFASDFNYDTIKIATQNAGLKYLFLGRELGGKPEEAAFYDADGHVDYAEIAKSQRFAEGIQMLVAELENNRTAIMCAEENPAECHRRRLIGPVLAERGIEQQHIRANGNLLSERELRQGEKTILDDFQQLTLFSQSEPKKPWRSSSPAKGK